jgi:hypothetical protein
VRSRARNIATTTEIAVARMAMPNELRSAEVNSSSLNTVSKFSQVHSEGKNEVSPSRNVCGLLNDSEVIHSSGNIAHSRIRTPQKVHQLLVRFPLDISCPP